jgi:hypothetical protein
MTGANVLLILLITGYAGLAVLGARTLLRRPAGRVVARVHRGRQGRAFPGSGLDSGSGLGS